MRFKANVFPIMDSLPTPDDQTRIEQTEEWDSVGENMHSKIPMNEWSQFHGVLQTFSNGNLLEERQYVNSKVFGFSVFYGMHGKPMSARLTGKNGHIARFNFK